MRPETELAGLATSALVLGASRLGLPVSTTHVSVGSILGIGAEGASLRARAARPRRCVADHRETYGVEPICSVLPIAPSTCYEQKARQTDVSRLPLRLVRDAELRVEIERVWKENRAVYGARKVSLQLKRKPPRRPASISARRTHFRSASAEQPIFSAIERIASHCDPYCSRCSKTRRTARSRTSWGYLILAAIAPSSQGLEPPAIRGGSEKRTTRLDQRRGQAQLYYVRLSSWIGLRGAGHATFGNSSS